MKTKIIITAMFLSSLTYSAFAQFDKEATIHSKWSISASINSVEAQMDQKLFDTWVFPSANYYAYFGDKHDKSISVSVFPKYQIADDVLFRFEFGITNIDLRSHFDGSKNNGNSAGAAGAVVNPDIIKDDIIQQKIYRFSPGIQWNFMKKKFIESYCGATINYFQYSKLYWSDYIEQISTTKYTHWTANTHGGFATGIGAFAGVNIYLRKSISIGGEFAYALLYYNLGGEQKLLVQ